LPEKTGARSIRESSKALDEKLDHVVSDTLWRRPRNENPGVRPEARRGEVPILRGIEHYQGASGPRYVLPSYRQKLKGQLPDNVIEAKKLKPVESSSGIGAEDVALASSVHPGCALISRKPALNKRREYEVSSKSLSSVSGKKCARKGLIHESGLHEDKRCKDNSVLGPKRKRFAI